MIADLRASIRFVDGADRGMKTGGMFAKDEVHAFNGLIFKAGGGAVFNKGIDLPAESLVHVL